MSSLLLSPSPRATFPSYDLCFPALPVKKEGGPAEEGAHPAGWSIEVGGGEGREVRMALGERRLGAWPLADAEITGMAPGSGCPLPSRVTSRLDSAEADQGPREGEQRLKLDCEGLQGASETPGGGQGNSTLGTSSDQVSLGPPASQRGGLSEQPRPEAQAPEGAELGF